MRYPQYEIFHQLTPLEMCIVNHQGLIIYHNKLMFQTAQGEDLKNKDISKILELKKYDEISSFFEDIKNNRLKVSECSLFGQTRFIKGSYLEKTKEIYFVFTPFEYDWSKQNNDALTGLPTRELFLDRAMQIIYRCQRHNHKMAILFLDLDGFKPVNDTYGHKAGDIVLKVISERMNEALRKTDTVARYGGDEFILALTELKEGIHASLGAKRILKLIERPIDIGDRKVSVSASIGISVFPEDGMEVKDLIKKADNAMYNAKNKQQGYSFYNMKQFLG